jgi:hypothetical protein
MPAHTKQKKSRGPAPERVKINGDWEEAVGKALKKERPKEGWPLQTSEKKPLIKP